VPQAGIHPTRQRLIDLQAQEVVFRVDFDLVGDDGTLRVSSRFSGDRRPPRSGARVYLIDDAGRGCVAVIEENAGTYALARPDWSTWTGGRLPAPAADGR
jgi:hypothetical protein